MMGLVQNVFLTDDELAYQEGLDPAEEKVAYIYFQYMWNENMYTGSLLLLCTFGGHLLFGGHLFHTLWGFGL